WWGSSGTRSGRGPGEYRRTRPAAAPPRSAVSAAARSRDLRARPPRPLPHPGYANARKRLPALTTSPSPTTGHSLPRFEDQDCGSARKILVCEVTSGGLNESLVLSVLVAAKASTGVRDTPVRRARGRDHGQLWAWGRGARVSQEPV